MSAFVAKMATGARGNTTHPRRYAVMFWLAATPIAATGTAFFGLSFTEVVIVFGAVGYIVSLLKDYRPIKTLRAENRELRALCEAGDKKIAALEAQVALLEKATNLTAFQEEQRHIADALEKVVLTLTSLDGAVRANTAAVELIASGSAIRQTIEDMNPPERNIP